MFRVTFLADNPAERRRLATELQGLTVSADARIVSACVYAKTVEVFLDVAEFAVPSEVADQLARSLGVDEYEVESAVPLATQTARGVAPVRRRLRPAIITQVRLHPDGCTLSVQARHRPYETIERVEVGQTDDAVVVTVLVGSPDDDDRDQYVSFAVAFSWVDAILDRPVGDRQIISDDPDRRPARPQPDHDEVREGRSSRSFRWSRRSTRTARPGRRLHLL